MVDVPDPISSVTKKTLLDSSYLRLIGSDALLFESIKAWSRSFNQKVEGEIQQQGVDSKPSHTTFISCMVSKSVRQVFHLEAAETQAEQ
jgi:hypothetical protein